MEFYLDDNKDIVDPKLAKMKVVIIYDENGRPVSARWISLNQSR